MAIRNLCIPFCKRCDFLEGIARLWAGMSFFWCYCVFSAPLHSILCPNLVPSQISSLKQTDACNFVCEPVCPSWYWLPEQSSFTQHEIYSLWAWWSQIFYAGRAITSEDQCTSNQALPHHEIRGHSSVQHVPGPLALWDLVAISAQYIAFIAKHKFNNISFHNNMNFKADFTIKHFTSCTQFGLHWPLL